MKIVHVDTEQTWRGGQQQVYSLIQGLLDRGHENIVVTARNSELARKCQGHIPVWPVSHLFPEWNVVSACGLRRRLLKEQVSLVHAHSGHGVALAVLSVMNTAIPVIATRRVDFPIGKNFFSRFKYGRLNHVIAISEGVRRILEESGIPPTAITVVHSGVDFRKYEGVRPLTKIEMGLPPGSMLIGQVAALAPHKDQRTFLRAAKLLQAEIPNVQFMIVGEGELRNTLEQEAKRLGLEKIMHLVGFKNRPLDYLSGFDVFCLSSKEEGLGTSIIDAMALQIPVVATKVGGIPELVNHGVTGYLASAQNPEELAEAIKTCIFSKDKNQLIRVQALKKAKEFDISNTIRKTEAIYSQLSTDLSTRSPK